MLEAMSDRVRTAGKNSTKSTEGSMSLPKTVYDVLKAVMTIETRLGHLDEQLAGLSGKVEANASWFAAVMENHAERLARLGGGNSSFWSIPWQARAAGSLKGPQALPSSLRKSSSSTGGRELIVLANHIFVSIPS